MNRSSTWTICGCLLIDLADQAIVVEAHLFRQSGEFYLAVFEDFILTVDNGPVVDDYQHYHTQITLDSMNVVFHDSRWALEPKGLFIVPIGGGTKQQLSGPLVSGGHVTGMTISPDGKTVVYRADQETDEQFELYASYSDGTPDPTETPTVKPTKTPKPTATATPTNAPTSTATATTTATTQATTPPTATASAATATATQSVTTTASPTVEATLSPTAEATVSPTATAPATPSSTPVASPTAEPAASAIYLPAVLGE